MATKREVRSTLKKAEPKPVTKPEPKAVTKPEPRIPVKPYVRPGTGTSKASENKASFGSKVTSKVSSTVSVSSKANTTTSRINRPSTAALQKEPLPSKELPRKTVVAKKVEPQPFVRTRTMTTVGN